MSETIGVRSSGGDYEVCVEAKGLDRLGERVRAVTTERKQAEEQVAWLMHEWEELSTALAAND